VKYAWIAKLKAAVAGHADVRGAGGQHQRLLRASARRRRQANPASLGPARLSNEALLAHIRAIHAEVKGEYGWPRVWKELLARGIRVGKERVQRLMQRTASRRAGKRKFVVTTDSKHDLPIAQNLLARDFTPAAPDRVWSSDITYIATDEGWLYLAAVIDLFSRQVVGWSMQPHMQASLVTDALRMAWFRRHPAPGLIFHSDRGSQYCSHDVPGALKATACCRR
jgi:putative transposase